MPRIHVHVSSDSPPVPEPGRRPRIALYSHDTQGLGHIRRNLLLARALSARGDNPVVLLLSGLHEAAGFDFPNGVDCVTLPSLGKDTQGVYFPRTLGVSMCDLMHLRRSTIAAAVESFRPDLLIVDKVPLGAFDELEPTLRAAREHAHIVLGLRDILDDPGTVAEEWRRGAYDQAIRAYHDEIWVYGDPAIYDVATEYAFPADIAARVRYTGYLDPLDPALALPLAPRPAGLEGDFVLCAVGGGRDGTPLAEAFVTAPRPAGVNGVLITGPLMPPADRARLASLAAAHPGTTVHTFVTDPIPFMRFASATIAMGGYNTTCEAIACGRPTLIVPRTQPRLEQLIRAERLTHLGAVDMLRPEALSPQSLGAWIATALARPDGPIQRPFDFAGVTGVLSLMHALLARRAEEPAHAAG